MSNNRQRLGQRGEDLAAAFLTGKGYKILNRNYSCRLGEIDIIARDSENLVFIEVKTRSSNAFGSPAAAVTLRKQRQISKVAQTYLQANKLCDIPARFDVVSIIINNESNSEIELIPNAFDHCG